MKNDICGIYMVENRNTGQRYIGQSIHIYQRWKEHTNFPNMSMRIDRAIKKHGADNFNLKVICELEQDDDLLNEMEKYYIWKFNTYQDKNHYNQTPGGDFNPMKVPEIAKKNSEAKKGKKPSEEIKKKMSEAKSGENNPMFGKKGEESPNFGRKHTPEAKARISKALSGENHPMYGQKLSEETRKKMSETHKNKKHSEETKKKISEARNTTGYFRVIRRKCPDCKNGLRYIYRYRDDNNKKHEIGSVDLEKLEQKVKAKSLEWLKFDDDDDNIFKIQESNKILYKIEGMRPTGHFYSTRRDLNLDIHQVLQTKHRALDKEITIAEAKEIATDIGVSYDVLQKVAYNLNTAVFDKYIAEWRARLANTL